MRLWPEIFAGWDCGLRSVSWGHAAGFPRLGVIWARITRAWLAAGFPRAGRDLGWNHAGLGSRLSWAGSGLSHDSGCTCGRKERKRMRKGKEEEERKIK